MKEDEEKFKFADEDGDGKLDLEEYMAFYHPGVSKRVDCKTVRISVRIQVRANSQIKGLEKAENGERDWGETLTLR